MADFCSAVDIAGHANPTVTLGHYTQAVRDGGAAIEALDRAYAL